MSYPTALETIAKQCGLTVVAKAVKKEVADEDLPKPRSKTKSSKDANPVKDLINGMTVQQMFDSLVSEFSFNPTEPNMERIFGNDMVFRVIDPDHGSLKQIDSKTVESAAITLLKSLFGDAYTDKTFTIHAAGCMFIIHRSQKEVRELIIKFYAPKAEYKLSRKKDQDHDDD